MAGVPDMVKYSYVMNGTAADNQTWETSGSITIAPGDFPNTAMLALTDTFEKLTQGKAVFGFPGVGCRGPYNINKLTIEKVE